MTLAIVNARGVRGAVGAVVEARDGEPLFLTCRHVAFGRGAGPGEVVWAIDESRGRRTLVELGRTLAGFQGLITHHGATCYVDAALGTLVELASLPDAIRHALIDARAITEVADGVCGAPVHKHGWLTGLTRGTIVDDRHSDRPELEGREHVTPAQLRIAPVDRAQCFSAPGESGSVVLDDANRAVGLIWGCTTYGEAIACPMAAVLAQLDVRLATR